MLTERRSFGHALRDRPNERRSASAANTPLRVATPSEERDCNIYGITSKPEGNPSVRLGSGQSRLATRDLNWSSTARCSGFVPTQVGTLGEFRSWRLREVSGAIHIVSQELDGFTTCTCMDFVARTSPKSCCKHILALLAVGLFDAKGGAA